MLDVECRARGTPMSKRSDSSTTAGSSSPPHPTCACSASNTLLAEWSTTPPTVSVFEQSGCDNMRLRWFKNILSLLSTSTDTNRDVVPEDLVFRLLQTELPIRIRHPFVRIRTQSALSPGRRRSGAFDSVFPQLCKRTCTITTNVVISTRFRN